MHRCFCPGTKQEHGSSPESQRPDQRCQETVGNVRAGHGALDCMQCCTHSLRPWGHRLYAMLYTTAPGHGAIDCMQCCKPQPHSILVIRIVSKKSKPINVKSTVFYLQMQPLGTVSKNARNLVNLWRKHVLYTAQCSVEATGLQLLPPGNSLMPNSIFGMPTDRLT